MSTESRIGNNGKFSIDPPRQDRPPLKNNIFDAMQKGNAQLIPLFPHLYPGAMVPAGAVLRGGPDKNYGEFRHHNTVDEVSIAFAANGALLKTGQFFVGGRVHGVSSFLKDEKNAENFVLICITQRQSESQPQHEVISMMCSGCREEIFRYEFDVIAEPDDSETVKMFATIPESYRATKEFSDNLEARTCSKCGHVNDPFPYDAWGWHNYAEQSDTVFSARQILSEAEDEMLKALEQPEAN